MTVGDSRLFEVDLAAGQTKEVEIAEATPVERALELSSDDALAMLSDYLAAPDAPAALRGQIQAVLATHRAAADLTDQIRTLHDQLDEYREREGELHAQLVSLQLVRTSGDLVAELRHRLTDISARVQQATLAVVDAQERLMLLHVKLENQLADLHLEDAPGDVSAR
jgi:rhamnose utilization protein RhaD (predicted bifunctional aldolase and dehydrogenase)